MTTSAPCQPRLAGLAFVLAAAIFLSAPGAAQADPPRARPPASLAVAITIDSENLIELYQSVPELKIIDSRYPEDYVQGYIETSYNLPLVDTDCAALDALTENREQALVFYCNGNAADASIAAIQIASACGYHRLFWFRGGFVEWEDKDYPYVIE